MENVSQQRNSRLILLVGLGTVFLLACIAISLFFSLRPPAVVTLRRYVTLGKQPGGEPYAEIDRDALFNDLHLPPPTDHAHAAERLPEVRALNDMQLFLSSTDKEDVLQVVVLADAETLQRHGIRFETLSWEQPITKRTGQSTGIPSFVPGDSEQAASRPVAGTYLSSLADDNGDGYNLRAVCERVQQERDALCREKLGDSYKADKLQVSFSTNIGDATYHNVYQASYRATIENEDPNLAVTIFFRVRLFNLQIAEDGTIAFDSYADVSIQKTEAECKRAPSSSQYETMILSGGGQRISGKPIFDQNGFVLFADQPTSYRMATGVYWSPTYELLTEDMIWKLTAADGYSLAKVLRYARKEIYARYYAAFDPQTEHEFYEHYRAYPWYHELSPDRTVDMTETERANMRLLREIQSLVEK